MAAHSMDQRVYIIQPRKYHGDTHRSHNPGTASCLHLSVDRLLRHWLL